MSEIEQYLVNYLNRINDINILLDDLNYIQEGYVNPSVVSNLIEALKGCKNEVEIWNVLLFKISPNSFTDELIEYFINNKICIVALGHLQLSDKWLKILSKDVEEALLTLATRFFTDNKYSTDDFINFILKNKSNIRLIEYLLLFYNNSLNKEKRDILIYCALNYVKDNNIKKLSHDIILSEQIRITANADEIVQVYNNCQMNNVVLLGIASNYNTPNDILLNLKDISNIKDAKKIRLISERTLRIKKIF